MTSTRRDFLIGGAAAGAAAPWLGGRRLPRLHAGGSAGETLVVVQVRGGWDFLNMVVKPNDPTYQLGRPNLAIPAAALLPVSPSAEGLGWHPAMAGFKTLFDRGDLAVVLNVGDPLPNLSHFTSEKKWATADPAASSIGGTGWLSTYLNVGYTGGFQIPAVNVGRAQALAFQGSSVATLRDPNSLLPIFDPQTPEDNAVEKLVMEQVMAYPRAASSLAQLTAQNTVQALQDGELIAATGQSYTPLATYPAGTLTDELQHIARFITGGLQTQIYHVQTGSFDTHSNQADANAPTQGTFATEIAEVCDPVRAFVEDLEAYNVADRVVVVIYSEFGRRIGENGALGTEHGHGGVAFAAGVPVRGGIYGRYPDLSQYNQSALGQEYITFNSESTDFRQVYATVLDKWLEVPHASVLGSSFPLLGFL